jgi:hypothetical protein
MLSAVAGPMPSSVDLFAVEGWEAAANRVMKGPEGCIEWVGEASYSYNVAGFGGVNGRQIFAGRTVDGVWSPLYIKSLGQTVQWNNDAPYTRYQETRMFTPLMGQIRESERGSRSRDEESDADKDSTKKSEVVVDSKVSKQDRSVSVGVSFESSGEAVNLVANFLDGLEGRVESIFAEWKPEIDSVVLNRIVPIKDKRKSSNAHIRATFPNGQERPTRVVVSISKPFSVGSFPRKAKVKKANIDLRVSQVGQLLYPTDEAYTLEASYMGISVVANQTIHYRSARKCE